MAALEAARKPAASATSAGRNSSSVKCTPGVQLRRGRPGRTEEVSKAGSPKASARESILKVLGTGGQCIPQDCALFTAACRWHSTRAQGRVIMQQSRPSSAASGSTDTEAGLRATQLRVDAKTFQPRQNVSESRQYEHSPARYWAYFSSCQPQPTCPQARHLRP